MSGQQHTPEPWESGRFYYPEDGGRGTCEITPVGEMGILAHFYLPTGLYEKMGPANALRAVACVNACAGMEDPEEEIGGALRLAREAADGALDESGLRECMAIIISQRDNAREACDNARAANGKAQCVYCGFTGPKDIEEECEKHPARAVLLELDGLRSQRDALLEAAKNLNELAKEEGVNPDEYPRFWPAYKQLADAIARAEGRAP